MPTRHDDDPESMLARQWHHRPALPIRTSPLFELPLRPQSVWDWVSARWLRIAENSILLILASISWFWFQPSSEETHSIKLYWVLEIYLRNLALMFMVAGGLHLFFYTRRSQADNLKYDKRPLRRNTRIFSFNNQVTDNMFWTLVSGVTVWTAFEVFMFWGMSNGWFPVLVWQSNPIWFIALFFLTPLWISFHFYWIHRLIHWEPLFKTVHALHHRNTNVGPWSGLSMHPVEHILFFSSILIHCIFAAHPLHILFHMQHQALTAATSHTGFEALLVKDKKRLMLGTFHHQMHHRYFTCNYGNLEIPLDRWFGTFHDGTTETHNRILKKRVP